MPEPTPAPGAMRDPPLLAALDRVDEGRLLGVLLALGLAFTTGAATLSDSVFHVDEYYQVVEFASFKLGITPASSLAWEFPARIRPWLQPATYVLLARGLTSVGVENPFTMMKAFRLLGGLLSWAALAALLVAVRRWYPSARWRRALYLSMTLPYFVPYLAARSSSERASTTFLVAGLAALVAAGTTGRGAGEPGREARASWLHLAAGLLLGLAFEMRYQAGVAVAGMVLWVLVHEGHRWRKALLLGAGIAVVVGVGTAVDAWGYGAWTFAPWNYFRANLLEGKAASFGTMPFFAYLGLMVAQFPPFGPVIMAGLVLFWIRRPRHLLTWATLSFFAVHSLIGHKEIRFLFPFLPLATLAVLLLWADAAPARRWEEKLLAFLRTLWFGRLTWVVNAIGLAALCLMPSIDNLELHRFYYEHAREPARWVVFTDPRNFHGGDATFLWPRPRPPVEVVDGALDLAASLDSHPGPVYVATKFPMAPGVEEVLNARGRRVFETMPRFLEKLNAFKWVNRADAITVWRVER